MSDWENEKSLSIIFKQFLIKNQGNGEYQYINKIKNADTDPTNDESVSITHTRMGSDSMYCHAGSYSIPSIEKDYWDPGPEFWGRLYKSLFVDNEQLSLTEKHLPNKGPILIDIDMKFDKDLYSKKCFKDKDSKITRRHTKEQLMELCKEVVEIIKNELDIEHSKIQIFVLERDSPYLDKEFVKDGIHIQIPIYTEYDFQFYLRDKILEKMDEIFKSLTTKIHLPDKTKNSNRWSSVYDKSVIKVNNWLIYGCNKPHKKPYKLSYVFDNNIEDVNIKQFTDLNLMKKLSIRCDNEDISIWEKNDKSKSGDKKNKKKTKELEPISFNGTDMGEDINDDLNHHCLLSKLNHSSEHSKNIERIREIVMSLNSDRAKEHDPWKKLGLCLHNICSSNEMRDIWDDFSQKDMKKYNQSDLINCWANFGNRKDGMFIGTLYRWLKEDNIIKFSEMQNNDVNSQVVRCVDNGGKDVDIARVLFTMTKSRCVCISPGANMWFEFANNVWRCSDEKGGCPMLIRLMSTTPFEPGLANYFWNYLSILHAKYAKHLVAVNTENTENMLSNNSDPLEEQKRIELKKQMVAEITDSEAKTKKGIKTSSRQKSIMETSKSMFNDSDKSPYDIRRFIQLLDGDSCIHLIAFKNGVLDITNGSNPIFRPGVPEDYVSMQINRDYIGPDSNDYDMEKDQLVDKFMEDIIPDEPLREYVWLTMASCLEGRNKEEKFHIWTGSGANGKSLLMTLLEQAFEMYHSKVQPTLVTNKRSKAENANPELAKTKGVRLITLQEPEEGQEFNSALIKELTGGDSVSTRKLYGESFTFKPQFTPIIMCNKVPSIPDADDEAIWRRMSVVPFKVKFKYNPNPNNKYEKQIDTRMKEKVLEWVDVFFAKLVIWYKKYYDIGGLPEPDIVKEQTDEFIKESDNYRAFFDECIRVNTTIKTFDSKIKGTPDGTLPHIMKIFRVWGQRHSITVSSTTGASRKRMEKIIVNSGAVKDIHNKTRTGWINVRCNANWEENENDNPYDIEDESGIIAFD
jgi:P4 family phage/plasmid primase-like protien